MRFPFWLTYAIYSAGYYLCRFAVWGRGWKWDDFVARWNSNRQVYEIRFKGE